MSEIRIDTLTVVKYSSSLKFHGTTDEKISGGTIGHITDQLDQIIGTIDSISMQKVTLHIGTKANPWCKIKVEFVSEAEVSVETEMICKSETSSKTHSSVCEIITTIISGL